MAGDAMNAEYFAFAAQLLFDALKLTVLVIALAAVGMWWRNRS